MSSGGMGPVFDVIWRFSMFLPKRVEVSETRVKAHNVSNENGIPRAILRHIRAAENTCHSPFVSLAEMLGEWMTVRGEMDATKSRWMRAK